MMMVDKPRLRFNYPAKAWFFVFYDEDGEKMENYRRGRRLKFCEICSGPAYLASWGVVCFPCREARDIEVRESHRVFAGAIREGQFQSLPDGKTTCVDCDAPAMVWEHRDTREPLSVEPCCRSCNRRRGRAMTAHEASFSQRTNDAPKPLHVDPICQPHQRESDESACSSGMRLT